MNHVTFLRSHFLFSPGVFLAEGFLPYFLVFHNLYSSSPEYPASCPSEADLPAGIMGEIPKDRVCRDD
jgi:hypothetical protein